MKICDYGCGREAKHQLKNGKWCCSEFYQSCPSIREKNSTQLKEVWKDPNSIFNSNSYRNTLKELHKDPAGIFKSKLYKEKQSNSMKKAWNNPNSELNSNIRSEKISNNMKKIHKDSNSKFNSISYKNKMKLSIKKINKKYPLFSKIEEIRYNPDKSETTEIQVHCKNHNCKNSKEKNGWFTPTTEQIIERRRALEHLEGNDGHYLYCSQHCKDTCILYNLHGDPYKTLNLPYTSSELDVFNKLVLKRDNEICYYCNKHHATIVHHRRPKKLEPFFALDPDYAISVCIKCHYKYGHPTGSKHSTGNLAKIVCSVESQKFLNQKMEFLNNG